MVKIFSNFDTNLAHELLTKYQQQYGVEKVIFVRRWGIYLVFKAFIPSFRATVLRGAGLIWYVFALEYSAILAVFVLIIVAALLIFWLRIFRKALTAIINFYLDFTIVTPQQISRMINMASSQETQGQWKLRKLSFWPWTKNELSEASSTMAL